MEKEIDKRLKGILKKRKFVKPREKFRFGEHLYAIDTPLVKNKKDEQMRNKYNNILFFLSELIFILIFIILFLYIIIFR